MRHHRRARLAALLALSALSLAACGGGDLDLPADEAAATTTTADGGDSADSPSGSTTSADGGGDGGGTGASGPSATVADGQEAAINIAGFAFDPVDLTVPAGTAITVTNSDAAAHTLTADDGAFDTGNLNEGQSGTVTPEGSGAIGYHCEIHEYMKGTIRIEG